jgi:purine-binding chemotaxis protein CheW
MNAPTHGISEPRADPSILPAAAPPLSRDQGSSCPSLAGKYMTFRLAEEEYGLEIVKVREIIGLMPVHRIPRTPDLIRGVINLRGKVIPVFDLRAQFGVPAAEATDQSVIIVVQCELQGRPLTTGLLVDQVLEVLSIDGGSIEAAPSLQGSIDTSLILGVAKAHERVVFLLDIARVLGDGGLASFA